MNSNDGETVSQIFRDAQDALLNMFRWSAERKNGEAVNETAERILRSQQQAVRMMTAMTGAWAEMAKGGFSGPDGVRTFMERMQKDMPPMGGAVPNAEMLEQSARMWRQGGERFVSMMTPVWQSFVSALDPAAWPESIKSTMPTDFLSSPGFGLSREYQAKVGKTFEAWLDYQKRDVEYRTLLGKAWTDAFGATMQKMSAKTAAGDPPKTARETLELWIDVADETFIGLFKTAEFSKTQSGLVNALMQFKKHRRALMEDALVASDLPTRREVDEAHRMIYTLRKELKAVKKALASSEAQKAVSAKEAASAITKLRSELDAMNKARAATDAHNAALANENMAATAALRTELDVVKRQLQAASVLREKEASHGQ